MFEKFKARRVEKKRLKDLYAEQEIRLNKMLGDLNPGTDEYEKIQSELKATNEMREKSRTSKGRASSGEKLGFWARIIGVGGSLATVGAIIFAEHKGMTFTGEKRSVMDSIAKTIGSIFVHR